LLIMSYPVSAKAKNCFSRRYVNESKSPIKSPFRTIGKLKVTKPGFTIDGFVGNNAADVALCVPS